MKWITLFLSIVLLSGQIHALFNPFKTIKCMFYECCNSKYVKKNFNQLEKNLDKYLFGQPLVKRSLVNALRSHFNLNDPQKALVLSFHGPTGVGKNYVTQFVAESIFTKGLKSKFFKLFICSRDFPHNDRIGEYKEKIKQTIESTLRECETGVFVFDEIHLIPNGLMDVITAYIDYNPDIGGVDYRRSVFIFLSNSGAEEITRTTLELNNRNIHRNQFQVKDFSDQLVNAAYFDDNADQKGMKQANIITKHLIDNYIPFLPLEREHVKNCIKIAFEQALKGSLAIKQSEIDLVADEISYEPPGLLKFASSGCKRVPFFIRNLITESGYEFQREL